jgi:hypothetical protein
MRNAETSENVTADAEMSPRIVSGRINTYPAAIRALTIKAASVASSRRSPEGT